MDPDKDFHLVGSLRSKAHECGARHRFLSFCPAKTKQKKESGGDRRTPKFARHLPFPMPPEKRKKLLPSFEMGKMETYLIVVGKTSTGSSALCPDVLGCAAVGETVEEVVTNMRKALELHFEGIVEDGEPIPKPGGVASYRKLMKDLEVTHYLLARVQIDTSRLAGIASRS